MNGGYNVLSGNKTGKSPIKKKNTNPNPGPGPNSFVGAGGTRYTGWTPGTYERNPAAVMVADALRAANTPVNSTTLSQGANYLIANRGAGISPVLPNYRPGSLGGGGGGGSGRWRGRWGCRGGR